MVTSAMCISAWTFFITSTGHGEPATIPVRRLSRSNSAKRGCSSSAMNIVGASASDDLVDHRPPGPRPGRSSNRELDAEPLGDTAELLRVALRLFQHGAKVALVLGQPVDDLVHRLQGLYAGLGPSLPLFLYGDEAEVARLVS